MAASPLLADTVQPQKTKTVPNPIRTHRRHTLEQLMNQLQLTPEQRKMVKQIRAAHRKKEAEIEGQIKVKRVELESEMEKTDSDKDKLAALTKEIGELQGQLLFEKISANRELEKEILTPQQTEQLKALELQENSETEENPGPKN